MTLEKEKPARIKSRWFLIIRLFNVSVALDAAPTMLLLLDYYESEYQIQMNHHCSHKLARHLLPWSQTNKEEYQTTHLV